MTERGEVVRKENQKIYVRFIRTSACAGCHACGMAHDEKEIILEFDEEDNEIKIGDFVHVEMPRYAVGLSVLLAYIIPLMMLFVGLLIGNVFFGQREIYTALLGIVLTVGSYIAIKLSEKRIKNSKLFKQRLKKE